MRTKKGTLSKLQDWATSAESRLADLAYERGEADAELEYYRKALELPLTWAAEEGNIASLATVSETYRNIGSAKARGGDLEGALESYRSAQKAAEQLGRRADTKPDERFVIINILTATGDLLAAPYDPNFNDPGGRNSPVSGGSRDRRAPRFSRSEECERKEGCRVMLLAAVHDLDGGSAGARGRLLSAGNAPIGGGRRRGSAQCRTPLPRLPRLSLHGRSLAQTPKAS